MRTKCIAFCFVMLATGCREESEPVTAAKRFASAVRARDTAALLESVDAQTNDHVRSAAERASDQIGGRRSVAPTEVLQVVDVDVRNAIANAELLSQSEEDARVRLVGVDGSEHDLSLVFENGDWKVSLPVPPKPVGGATSKQ